MRDCYNEVNLDLRVKLTGIMQEGEGRDYAFEWCARNYFHPWEEHVERDIYLNKLKEYGC